MLSSSHQSSGPAGDSPRNDISRSSLSSVDSVPPLVYNDCDCTKCGKQVLKGVAYILLPIIIWLTHMVHANFFANTLDACASGFYAITLYIGLLLSAFGIELFFPTYATAYAQGNFDADADNVRKNTLIKMATTVGAVSYSLSYPVYIFWVHVSLFVAILIMMGFCGAFMALLYFALKCVHLLCSTQQKPINEADTV